jgi:hypothetical protein
MTVAQRYNARKDKLFKEVERLRRDPIVKSIRRNRTKKRK